MCGIAGAVLSRGDQGPINPVIDRMVSKLAHRGPDGNGVYCEPILGFGFGHTRLSILDLSLAGAQPIRSSNNNVVMVFNGEIYNHLELRQELASEAHETLWNGHSDSETLVELISTWGVKRTLKSLQGMFAFASFDFQTKTLTLARDIAGEKPLLYGQAGGKWGFASELSALEVLFGDLLTVNENVLAHFMDRSYLPAGQTIYREIHKLSAGSFVELGLSEIHSATPVDPQLYWESPAKLKDYANEESPGSLEESNLGYLEEILKESVRSQLRADVPVGSFLSGGIDSSLVSAIATEVIPNLKTFSVGFEDPSLDEAPHAKKVANFLGSEHYEIYVSSSELAETATKMVSVLDEPFADSSAIPSLILSRFAKDHVAVALTGDGGDELFGGYPRYQRAKNFKKLMKIPFPVRKKLSASIEQIPTWWVQKLAFPLSIIDKKRFGGMQAGEKIKGFSRLFGSEDDLQLYQGLLSSGGSNLLNSSLVADSCDYDFWFPEKAFVDTALLFDFKTFLPADILYKVDRTSMAHGFETRAPLLGRQIIEFAHSLSSDVKIPSGIGKWHLRQVLRHYLPEDLWNRPKAGFSMPMANLLRKDLRSWASEQIYPSIQGREDLFNYQQVQRSWSRHLSLQEDRSTELWNFLTLSTWLSLRNAKPERPTCK